MDQTRNTGESGRSGVGSANDQSHCSTSWQYSGAVERDAHVFGYSITSFYLFMSQW